MPSVVSYTSVSAMLLRMPSVASLTNATSVQLAAFASAAEAEMIGRLSKLYTLPPAESSPPNRMLETIATELALQKFLSQRAFVQEQQNKTSWLDAFNTGRELLNDLADSKIVLVDNAGAIIAALTTNEVVQSNTDGYLPTFTEDSPLMQKDDETKIEDLRSERDEL